MDEEKCLELLSLIKDNVDHFETSQTEYGQRFSKQFRFLYDAMVQLRIDCSRIAERAHLYDFDAETVGNGYRSSITILNRYIPICIKLCNQVISSRDSLLFSRLSDFYQKQLEANVSVVSGLQVSAQFLIRMLEVGSEDLFVSEKLTVRELLEEYGALPQVGFYGRLAGFYVSGSKVSHFSYSSRSV